MVKCRTMELKDTKSSLPASSVPSGSHVPGKNGGPITWLTEFLTWSTAPHIRVFQA